MPEHPLREQLCRLLSNDRLGADAYPCAYCGRNIPPRLIDLDSYTVYCADHVDKIGLSKCAECLRDFPVGELSRSSHKCRECNAEPENRPYWDN